MVVGRHQNVYLRGDSCAGDVGSYGLSHDSAVRNNMFLRLYGHPSRYPYPFWQHILGMLTIIYM